MPSISDSGYSALVAFPGPPGDSSSGRQWNALDDILESTIPRQPEQEQSVFNDVIRSRRAVTLWSDWPPPYSGPVGARPRSSGGRAECRREQWDLGK